MFALGTLLPSALPSLRTGASAVFASATRSFCWVAFLTAVSAGSAAAACVAGAGTVAGCGEPLPLADISGTGGWTGCGVVVPVGAGAFAVASAATLGVIAAGGWGGVAAFFARAARNAGSSMLPVVSCSLLMIACCCTSWGLIAAAPDSAVAVINLLLKAANLFCASAANWGSFASLGLPLAMPLAMPLTPSTASRLSMKPPPIALPMPAVMLAAPFATGFPVAGVGETALAALTAMGDPQ